MPFGAPYGHFADAASTIKEAHHPRVLAWGPAGDHTLCAMVNDLRVCEPLARRSPCHTPAVTWGNAYRDLLAEEAVFEVAIFVCADQTPGGCGFMAVVENTMPNSPRY